MTLLKKLLLGGLAVLAACQFGAKAQGVVNGIPNLEAFCSTQGAVLNRNGTKWTCLPPGTSGQVLKSQGPAANLVWQTVAGTGTVTSVAATVPADESVGGSPITVSGTLAITRNSQTQNLFLASPNGSSGVPTYRALVGGDFAAGVVPSASLATVAIAQGGSGQVTAGAAFNALSPITATGDLIVGTGVNTAGRIGIGGNNTVLNSNGTTASWGTVPSAALATVAIAQGGTGQVTAGAAFNALSPITSTGDLILGSGVNTASRLAIGGNNTCLTSNATTASWVACPTFTGGTLTSALVLAPGTTVLAPLKFQSGTNLTTAVAGALEFDGTSFYASAAASTRQVVDAYQIIRLTGAYTLASSTSAQKLFNASTNGAVTLAIGSYTFHCNYSISSLNSSSGTTGFALGGAATFTQAWNATATRPATLAGGGTPNVSYNTAASTAIDAASTNTNGIYTIDGVVNVTVAGTVIPQVSTSLAAVSAAVGVNSFCSFAAFGGTATATVGNWN